MSIKSEIVLDFYIYKVANAIIKTRQHFVNRYIEWLNLDNTKYIIGRVSRLFTTNFFDSISLFPSKHILPQNYKVSKEEVYRYCDIYLKPKPSQEEIDDFSKEINDKLNEYMEEVPITPTLKLYQGRIIVKEQHSVGFKPFRLSHNQLNLLYDRYQGTPDNLIKSVITLIYVYSSLSHINYHLSIPPSLLTRLQIDVELFGSPLNTQLNRYCSAFPEIETIFGSVGNYFDYNLVSNTSYSFNPPYVPKLIRLACQRLKEQISKIENYFIFGVLPNWDVLEGFEILKTIPTFIGYISLDKDEHSFYNYYDSSYLGVCNSNVFVITDRKSCILCDKIAELWKNNRMFDKLK